MMILKVILFLKWRKNDKIVTSNITHILKGTSLLEDQVPFDNKMYPSN
jgi:hypothetical protein